MTEDAGQYVIRLTKESYHELKRNYLAQLEPFLRHVIQKVITMLSRLDPNDVIDAIEDDKTVYHVVKKNAMLRVELAGARGALKYLNGHKEKVDKFLDYDNVMYILEYENPQVFNVVTHYGKQGELWMQDNIDDLKKLLLEDKKKAKDL